ncbi:LytR/AlgR family response regulator transcription factor [Aliikangiella maris]|uniref:LytTR family DNA-binding domain-containing protein n=2 Tax=Aliikangiella maris TaxID=3162458 RepID=A0ABV2BYX4_9GAMM
MNIKILVAEDELILRTSLIKKLNKYWPEAEIIAEESCGLDALKSINELKPDVAFLDIKMGDLTGIQVANNIEHPCHIIFVTAFDKYAIQAFESGALDYLLKPYSDDRLYQCITRTKKLMNSQPSAASPVVEETTLDSGKYLSRLRVKIGSKLWFLPVDDIICFKANGRYVKVVTAEKEALIESSLKTLYEQLSPEYFWQVHRSTIININYLKYVNTDKVEHLQAIMDHLDEPITISRRFNHLFR